ncbi:helix-turn-helix domain-containing protein [Mesobacillus harenae]|uniref:helix-turn-helix domain-containing protein n=1 Tax=Mesobacillus harenae TaxID=2213203 RepID=UPI001F558C7D|nr:helix-turn-helix domain-containing protein [Mesobacillus harenae]
MFLEIKDEDEKEEIMTIREAADYLKVSVPTVRNMIASKEIPFFQRGQVIRLNRWDVKEWLRKNSYQ